MPRLKFLLLVVRVDDPNRKCHQRGQTDNPAKRGHDDPNNPLSQERVVGSG